MIFRGGIHAGVSFYGSINATWPFAKLRIEKDSLDISSPIGNPKFPRAQITKLSKYSGFFSKGLRIEHTANQPPFIVFWTFDFHAVKRCLEENGYRFSE
jgi:hypothetical protein